MLPELELRKALISLSQNPRLKVQLILASPELPNAKEIPDGTKFRVNRAFALIKGGKVAPRGKVSLIGRLALTAEKNSRKDDEVKKIDESRNIQNYHGREKSLDFFSKKTLNFRKFINYVPFACRRRP